MSAEAISPSTFIRECTRELHNNNAADFAGAGLSVASGYVDYPGATATFRADFEQLGDVSTNHDELRAVIQRLIEQLQKA